MPGGRKRHGPLPWVVDSPVTAHGAVHIFPGIPMYALTSVLPLEEVV